MADVNKLEDIELFAWVGEDEMGSGEIGIKQARCAAGMIPMVAIRQEKMDQEYIREQLHAQGIKFSKKISLCRFKFDGVVGSVGNLERRK
jgi:hypothetical protein